VNEFEDVSRVEKFELSEEEYEKRRGRCLCSMRPSPHSALVSHSRPKFISGTVQDFKKRNQLGRFAPDFEEQASLTRAWQRCTPMSQPLMWIRTCLPSQVEAKEREGEEEAAKISKGDRCVRWMALR
jgi:hypothetical protein